MDHQTCENCARRNKETGKCTLPMRNQMAHDGWCYRWLEEDKETQTEQAIGKAIWTIVEKALEKNNV